MTEKLGFCLEGLNSADCPPDHMYEVLVYVVDWTWPSPMFFELKVFVDDSSTTSYGDRFL